MKELKKSHIPYDSMAIMEQQSNEAYNNYPTIKSIIYEKPCTHRPIQETIK